MYVCVYVGVRTTVWGFLKSHSSSLLLATVWYLHIEFEFEEEVERKQKPEGKYMREYETNDVDSMIILIVSNMSHRSSCVDIETLQLDEVTNFTLFFPPFGWRTFIGL